MRTYDLVVIGSSAGGIEALTTLVASLPPDFGAAVVIAQHLDPTQVSHLGEILARHTALAVHIVVAQEPLTPGVIYVVPADHDVEITDHHVGVLPHGISRSTPSVNRLFSSAARAHGEQLIGVILTGAGSDGASGARDVKAAGGTVISENPATAAYASMPLALAPTTVDFVLDLAQIGPVLGALVAGTYLPSPNEAETALPTLLDQVRARTGIDFSSYKSPTILRRLQRRLAMTQMATLEAYLQYLAEHPDEYALLTASILINVTEFFRDPEVFAVLRHEILPGLIAQARAQDHPLRFWSAGCSTGEEAYSLAILLAEVLGDVGEPVPVRIFATDVDADAIAFARRGLYPPTALAALPAEVITRAFLPMEGGYAVAPAIRDLVTFGQHDLGARAPFPQIDLVLCRNVLIYFDVALQRRALQLFAFALRDGGYLALGKAETPAPFAAYFAPVFAPLKLYRRQGARVVVPAPRLSTQPLFLTTPVRLRPPAMMPPLPVPTPTGRLAISNERVGALLVSSPVGVVVVDRQYDLQMSNRAAQQILGIFRPALGEDLIHLVVPELAQPLRAAIDAALATPTAPTEVLMAVQGGAPRALHVTALAVADTVLLQITDGTVRQQAQQTEDAAKRHRQTANAPAARRVSVRREHQVWEAERQQARDAIAHLTLQRDQLTLSNQTLRAANDALATANLTITGLNEDLVVRHEELQASSEEIKTLNEELQATNEELETLNEEMESTVEELHATNDDLLARTTEVQHLALIRAEQQQASTAKAGELVAILHCMGDAVLVVNQAGEIQLTNAAYDTLFGATGLVVGVLDEDDQPLPPQQTPQLRMAAGLPFRMVFTQPDAAGERHWFEATSEPITITGVAMGGVLTIRDITDRSLRRLQDEFLALASHELRSPLTVMRISTQILERRLSTEDTRLLTLLTMQRQQGQRLDRLITDLTDVTRLQSGNVQLTLAPVEVLGLITQTVAAFQLTTPQPPVVVEAAGPLLLLGDAVRLEQILINLLTNASKYAAASPQIVVRASHTDSDIVIAVQDQGPGIAPAALPHLFQRYYQVQPEAQEAHSGLGLGLFITQALVVAHGGRIAVTSQLGQGTTFTLHFPLLAAAP